MDAQGMNNNGSAPQYMEEENLDVKEWVFKILGIWQYILLSIVMCVGLVYLYHRYATPRFDVGGTILIKEDKKSINPELLQELQFFQGSSTKANEIEILSSYTLLKRTIESLNFDIEYYGIGRIKEREIEMENMPFHITYVGENRPERTMSFMLELKEGQSFVLFRKSWTCRGSISIPGHYRIQRRDVSD
jgi:tyrosine-protein kinase Etk/Wzc